MSYGNTEAQSTLQSAGESFPSYVECAFNREKSYEFLLGKLPSYYLAARDLRIPEHLVSGRQEQSDFLEDMQAQFPRPSDFDTTYLRQTRNGEGGTLETVRHYQEMLEPLTDTSPTPDRTICIPVALLGESDETLRVVMEQITRSADDAGNHTRVIIWGNTKLSGSLDKRKDLLVSANERYVELKKLFAEYSSDTVQITTALDTPPNEEFSMSILRNHYMDALIGEVLDGKIPADHPVMWLDADTTHISPKTFAKTDEMLREFPLEFSHPDVDYSLEWTKDTSPREFDNSSKVFLIDEMSRRSRKRVAIKSGIMFEERRYPEESGMSFTMLGYMAAGGIDTHDPVNETVNLIKRLEYFRIGGISHFSDLSTTAEQFMSPSEKVTYGSATQVRSTHWLNDVKIRLSGRRIYEGIKSHGVESLAKRESSVGDDYVLYSDLTTPHTPDITLSNDSEQLRSVLLRNDYLSSQRQRKLSKQVVERMLNNKNLWP